MGEGSLPFSTDKDPGEGCSNSEVNVRDGTAPAFLQEATGGVTVRVEDDGSASNHLGGDRMGTGATEEEVERADGQSTISDEVSAELPAPATADMDSDCVSGRIPVMTFIPFRRFIISLLILSVDRLKWQTWKSLF